MHLLAAGSAVLAPRLIPADKPPADQGTIELLMEERKGTEAAAAGEPAQQQQTTSSQAMTRADDPTEAAAQNTDTGTQQPRSPAAASAKQALVMDFSGTDSPSNATVAGDKIVPASLDNRFRNRPPDYPPEAAMHGHQGRVVVLIHVSENGIPRSIEMEESSGYRSLDEAVIRAVKKWHFRPAIRDGRAEPFDMPFSFVFEG